MYAKAQVALLAVFSSPSADGSMQGNRFSCRLQLTTALPFSRKAIQLPCYHLPLLYRATPANSKETGFATRNLLAALRVLARTVGRYSVGQSPGDLLLTGG